MARRDPELCAEFRGYVEKWRKANRDNIQQYHDFHRFVLGSQWEDDEEQLLKNYNKIPLTANKIAPLMNHLCGEQCMNTPNLQVTPDENGGEEETVAIRQALIKEISLDSKAKTVYQIAFQQAGIGGFGAYRISSEYINNKSFDQIPIIQPIRDATRCFWDLGAETVCKTDGMHAGLYTKMSRTLFIKKYGRKVEATIPPTVTETEEESYASFEWSNDDSITIGECYKRKLVKTTIYELSSGDVIDQDEMKGLEKLRIANEFNQDEDMEYLIYNGMPVTIERERKIVSYKIKHYKWAGDFILDETDFPSQQLPIIFVDQNSYYDKTGKQICRPFIKDARDSQRFINYLVTQIAYLIKISRYDQFMASRANVKSPKTQLIWKNPSVHQGALIYDNDKEGGSKPEQLRPPELPISLIQQYERACNDIQTSTGIYDTKVGEQGNEISGAAIDARTRQGSYNTYIVFNSLNRAIAVGGEIIDEMIPNLFDTERKVTLDMPNEGKKTVTLNQQADEYGTTVKNDMSKGSYKVRLLPGPSYEGQKAELFNAISMILQIAPQYFTILADLLAKSLPTADTVELVNRLRTLVPPEILEAGKTGKPIQQKPQQPGPDVMVKMQELALKQQELQQKQEALQQTAKKDGMDYSIQQAQLENERLQIAGEIQDQILRYKGESNRSNADLEIAHAENLTHILTHPNKFNQHDKNAKAT
jgi:hypothetical protein